VSRFVISATWDDAPHLTPEQRKSLWDSIPEYQRDARTKGIPQLGSGAIFPFSESEFVIDPFDIPAHWPRAYGMDAGGGAKPTAAVWGALDRQTQTLYLYDNYRRSLPEPSVHASAIKARGDWIRGVGDCAALIVTDEAARQIIDVYRDLGLDVELPNKAVESGVYEMWTWFSGGRIKVFKTMSAWLEEFRLYRRDDKGRIVKANDHLMDASRYLIVSGLDRARVKPVPKTYGAVGVGTGGSGWMA
jgi:hypothetical protein